VKIEITDDDIEYAEKLLLPGGAKFNDERRAFIRCMESRDVVACPGSGKTTALLAKLLILARKMPFEDGHGICVLTHTNVAIDEIKKRARIASASLFRYPNFFGTIHSFVGAYLALPAYIDLFGHRDIRIDDELYRIQSNIEFNKHGIEQNGVIYSQLKNRLNGISWHDQRKIKQEFFNNLEFKFEDGYISYCRNKRTVVKGKNPSKSYGPIHSAKYDLLKRGYLRYQDVFPLGDLYISNNKNISSLFRSRFLFLFVDEMQDSDESQIKILDSVFPPSTEIIIQRIGDPNQAIYHDIDVDKDFWSPRNPLQFSDSRRYGKTIEDFE
jgi:DNA helicase II / ATP-dependent DNA helicase PcrA